MKRLFVLFLSILFILSMSTSLMAENYAKIYASSNLEYVFIDMIKAFYKQYPNDSVHIEYGSSGYLYSKILNGNDYDIFLSADMSYPKKLYKKGLAFLPAKPYIRGFLVLVAPKNIIRSISDLQNNFSSSIIVPNSKNSPYGRAIITFLKNERLYDNIKRKIKYVKDMGLVVDEVLWRGNIGFMPTSFLAMFDRNKITYILIDKTLYPPILQGYVISKKGSLNNSAMDFIRFLSSKKGIEIFEKYGYGKYKL